MSGVWVVVAALAATAPQTGSAAVDAFIADLATGRRDQALARIYEMNSLSGRPNAVALADEFVDKLLDCSYVSSQTRSFGGDMYDVRWRCPDGDYHALLDPSWRPPRIVVGEFVSAAEREERRRHMAAPPPTSAPLARMPEPSAEERRRTAERYLDALRHSPTAPPSSNSFLVRFADGRPNAYIGAEQLRRFLAPCREASVRTGDIGHTIVDWACSGPGALDANLTTAIIVSGDRVTGGLVWVGPLPGVPTVFSPH